MNEYLTPIANLTQSANAQALAADRKVVLSTIQNWANFKREFLAQLRTELQHAKDKYRNRPDPGAPLAMPAMPAGRYSGRYDEPGSDDPLSGIPEIRRIQQQINRVEILHIWPWGGDLENILQYVGARTIVQHWTRCVSFAREELATSEARRRAA
jgi:hypothetical protein